MLNDESLGRRRSVLLDHPLQRDAGINDDRHAAAMLMPRRGCGRGGDRRGWTGREADRRAGAPLGGAPPKPRAPSRPQPSVRGGLLLPSSVLDAAARRRIASIMASSRLRMMICPMDQDVDSDIT